MGAHKTGDRPTTAFLDQSHRIMYQLEEHVKTNVLIPFPTSFNRMPTPKSYLQSRLVLVINAVVDMITVRSVFTENESFLSRKMKLESKLISDSKSLSIENSVDSY